MMFGLCPVCGAPVCDGRVDGFKFVLDETGVLSVPTTPLFPVFTVLWFVSLLSASTSVAATSFCTGASVLSDWLKRKYALMPTPATSAAATNHLVDPPLFGGETGIFASSFARMASHAAGL